MIPEHFKRICEEVPEIQLYYVINTKGGDTFYLNHDLADGRTWGHSVDEMSRALTAAQEMLQFAVEHTTRFGLKQPVHPETRLGSAEYWAWFRWWDTYTRSLSEDKQDELFEVFNEIGEVIDGRSSASIPELAKKIEHFRPEGDWKTLIKN